MTEVTNEPASGLKRPLTDNVSRVRAERFDDDGPLAPRGSRVQNAASFPNIAAALIVVFWVFHFVVLSLDRFGRGSEVERTFESLAPRALVTLFAIAFSFLILRVLERTAGVSFLGRALIALGLAATGALFHSLLNILFFLVTMGRATVATSLSNALLDFPWLAHVFFWPYLAVTLMLLSLRYGQELVNRERQIAELSWDADRARLQALRYQLNPHFLFNALNSAASLVASSRKREAELMLVNLGDFLRTTLKLGPGREITLRDELHLQTLYLEVERVRYPTRLRVSTDVPTELMDVLVPNLITQPLIENAIKHSVARSSEPVHLEIRAHAIGDEMMIEITDDGGGARRSQVEGTGVGLQNVAKRLQLHFGGRYRLDAGPAAGSGFLTRMTVPIRKAK